MLFNKQLDEIKKFRKEVQTFYSEYKKQLPLDCAKACSLPSKEDRLFMLRAIVYICACNLDVQNAEMVYRLAQTKTLFSEDDYTIHDFVIDSCYERGDIVTAFKWILLANQGKEDALRMSIGACLSNFKKHPNLELVYTDLLNTLTDEYYPQEEEASYSVVRDAVIILLARLLRFQELIQRIENEPVPSMLYCRLWLEHKLECADIENETIEYINDSAIRYWRKLADACSRDQHDILEIGRLVYPMKWYLEHQGDEDRRFFDDMFILLLYVNHHITRIKEMLNIPLGLLALGEHHITMYMRPGKFNRVFSLKKGANQVYWSLTCADHMNDDFEGTVFFDYLKECGVSLFDQSICQFGLIDGNERASVFLGSVSETFDDEYMYALYASDKGTKGFCVEIDVTSFDDIIEDSLANDEYEWLCPLYRMLYANRIDDIIMPNVKDEIKKLGKSLSLIGLFTNDYKEKSGESVLSFSRMIYRMLEEIIYLFKKKSGPDNTTLDENGFPIIRNWEREREIRMMKCVRGVSPNIVESEKCDNQNRHYLNYITHKRIIVKNIRGGSSEEALKEAKKRIIELQMDWNY